MCDIALIVGKDAKVINMGICKTPCPLGFGCGSTADIILIVRELSLVL